MPAFHPFKLERYFALYEFKAPYILSASDCEPFQLEELLALADPDSAGLWRNLSLGYTESAGHPALRQDIAGLYGSIKADEVLVTAPEEGIFIAMQTLLQPGDEVVAVSPAYQSLQEIARSIGCKLNLWNFETVENRWKLDLNRLESLLTPHTRLLVINFPHNPTGYLPDRSELETVLTLADRCGAYVFSDEMYRLLEYDDARPLPAVCDLYGRGITLSGMSKAFALPGLRIGWLATHCPGLMECWTQYKDYTTICSSAPSEILAIIGLRARQVIVARNLEIIKKNITLARELCDRHPDLFGWLPPQAGSIAFPEWRGPGSLEAFCQGLIDRRGVMIVPGSLFDFPGQHFRLGLGRRRFVDGLERVEEELRSA